MGRGELQGPCSIPLKRIEVTHECFIHNVSEQFMHFQWGPVSDGVLHALREQISGILQLPPTAPFKLTYLHQGMEPFNVTSDDNLMRALRESDLVLSVVRNCSDSAVNVVHGDAYHVLTLPTRQKGFCFEQFHGRVRNLFQLPSAAPFRLIHEQPLVRGPHMIVTNADELKSALMRVSPNYLQLNISIIEDDSETNVNSPNTQESSSKIVKIRHNGALRVLNLSPGECQEISFEQFESRLRDMFKISRSAEFQLRYVDNDGDHVAITEGQELKDALLRFPGGPLRMDMNMIAGDNDVSWNATIIQGSFPYIVKVIHNGGLRRLTVTRDELQFSCEKLRIWIRDVFKLPPSAQFELSYIVQDQDNIMLVEDADLRDALVRQSLHPLKVNMKVISKDNDLNLDPPIA